MSWFMWLLFGLVLFSVYKDLCGAAGEAWPNKPTSTGMFAVCAVLNMLILFGIAHEGGLW